MTININDKIKVKLTKHGEWIHFNHYKELLGEKCRLFDLTPKYDSEGYAEYQLWEFANIFGEYLFNGAENVIEENKMIILTI